MQAAPLQRKSAMASDPPFLTKLARQTPVGGEYEVIVLGGGPAGIAAAVSPVAILPSTNCKKRWNAAAPIWGATPKRRCS